MKVKIHGCSVQETNRPFLDSHWKFIYRKIMVEMLIPKQSIAKYQWLSMDMNIPCIPVWVDTSTPWSAKEDVWRVQQYSENLNFASFVHLWYGKANYILTGLRVWYSNQTLPASSASPLQWSQSWSNLPTALTLFRWWAAEVCNVCTKWSLAKSCHTVSTAWRCRQMCDKRRRMEIPESKQQGQCK